MQTFIEQLYINKKTFTLVSQILFPALKLVECNLNIYLMLFELKKLF